MKIIAKLQGITLTRSKCPHCIRRKEIGLCWCSDHCDDHKFISHLDQMKLRNAYEKKKKEEQEKHEKSISRPTVIRRGDN